MNATLFLSQFGARFHPATWLQFKTCAEHLGFFIGCNYIDSREILALIYGYRNVYELEKVLKMPGKPGPFDDAILAEICDTEKIKGAVAARNEQAMQIIFDRISARRGSVQPKFTLQQFSALELFSSPLAHKAAFMELTGTRSMALSANASLDH